MESLPRFLNPHAITKTTGNRLPHWDQQSGTFFITYRLVDSIPRERLESYQLERKQWDEVHGPRPWSLEIERSFHRQFTRRFERWLDHGDGECLLRDPEHAAIVAEALAHFEGERSRLHAWVIMPNHVHVLVSLVGDTALADLLRTWKGFTARRINERRGRAGSIWQKSYFDRLVRDWEHFARCARYIRNNPTNAHLREGEYLHGESDLVRQLLA